MFEFRPHDTPPEAAFDERCQAFGEWFDMDVDPSVELGQLVLRMGDMLEVVFGSEQTTRAMLPLVTFGQGGDDWRALTEEFDNYGEWDLGSRLIGLLTYAVFGVVHGAPFSQKDDALSESLDRARKLIDGCSIDGWLNPPESSPLRATVLMAEGRRDIDARRSIAPEALAHLGGVKLSRIRNMISGQTPDLPRDEEGKILYEPAMAWLTKREAFLPTIWRDQAEDGPNDQSEALPRPVFVPVARDGSIFHPGLCRKGLYQIGPKDSPEHVDDFDRALAALQHAHVAQWRRPNSNGNWGLVSAFEWRRVDRSDLDALARATAAQGKT